MEINKTEDISKNNIESNLDLNIQKQSIGFIASIIKKGNIIQNSLMNTDTISYENKKETNEYLKYVETLNKYLNNDKVKNNLNHKKINELLTKLIELNNHINNKLIKLNDDKERDARQKQILKLELSEIKKTEKKELNHRKKISRDFINEIKHRQEKNWNIKNTETIVNWIIYSNLYILLLDTYSIHLKGVLRFNTLWSLLVSSITSTFSITQISLDSTSTYGNIVKWLILGSSLITSVLTGYIKIEKIQETIDNVEKNRAKWLNFMLNFTEQINESASLRTNADDLIVKHRSTFQKLFSKRIDIPKFIKINVSEFLTEGNISTQIANETLKRKNSKYGMKPLNNIMKKLKHRTVMMIDENLNNDEENDYDYEYDSDDLNKYYNNSCFQRFFKNCCCKWNKKHCTCTSRCTELKKIRKQVINDTKRQIEMYYNINTMAKNELLLLAQCYGEKIKKLVFDKDTYLLKYKIIRKDINFYIDETKNGFQCYNVNSPVQSDDEESIYSDIVCEIEKNENELYPSKTPTRKVFENNQTKIKIDKDNIQESKNDFIALEVRED